MLSSKIYINKGDLKFEDITSQSGLNQGGWATGVSLADINADGWLDLSFIRSCHALY